MNEVIKTLHNLRSTHGDFSQKEVSDEDLKTILDACVCAANASARQAYSVVVVKDRQRIKNEFAYEGSKALLFCVDYTRIYDMAGALEKEFDAEGILSFITGATDTFLAAQTAAIAARSLGIDSLFTNSIYRRDIDSLYDAFKLPQKYCFPLIALILGYAESEPAYQKGRISGAGIIHFDEYRSLEDADVQNLIAQYDQRENNLGLIQDWEKQGFKHYLDWFYTSWCEKMDIKKEKEVYDILERAAFIERTF